MLGFHSPRRVAFVAGVSTYAHLDPLSSCANDCVDMRTTLERMGFAVTAVADADYATLEKEKDAFVESARGADYCIFYFSGHGIQHAGENYLLAKDADPYPPGGRYKGLAFSELFDKLTESTKVTVAMLDACRTPPPPPPRPARKSKAAEPAPRDDGSAGAKPAAASGMQAKDASGAFVQETADGEVPQLTPGLHAEPARANAVVAFAAAPGEAAWIGGGRNSIFTAAVLEQLDVPGLPVADLFTRVTKAVGKATGNQQVPWKQDNLQDRKTMLRQRSYLPAISLFVLAAIGLVTCYAFRSLDLFSTNTFAGQSVFFGLLFGLLVGFSVWRWGEASARPALAAAFALFVWGSSAFFYQPATSSGPAPSAKVAAMCDDTQNSAAAIARPPCPDLVVATPAAATEGSAVLDRVLAALRSPLIAAIGISLATMVLLATEVQQFRNLVWIAGPAVVVGAFGFSLFNLLGVNLGEGDYYSSGLWILPFATTLGIGFSLIVYSRTNHKRRLSRAIETPEKVFVAAACGAAAGAIAAISGEPLIGANPNYFYIPVPFTNGAFMNWFPGVLLAVSVGGAILYIVRRDWWQPALATFMIWCFVLWLMNATHLVTNDEELESFAQVIAGSLILGTAVVAFVGLLQSRIWRVPVWLFTVLASIAGTSLHCLWYLATARKLGAVGVPAEIIEWLASAGGAEGIQWLPWALLYAAWGACIVAVVAYAVSADRPSP